MPAAERRTQPRRTDPLHTGGRRAVDPPAEWVSITAYAKAYSLSRPTVYKWIDGQLLTTCRVGKLIRIRNQPPIDSTA